MNHKLGCNYEQFDACLKAGHGSKLVSLVLNSDSPSSESKLRRLPANAFTRRVSCSLSAASSARNALQAQARKQKDALIETSGGSFPYWAVSTQRTEASPCAVRTRDEEHCSLNLTVIAEMYQCDGAIANIPSPSKAHVQSQEQSWRVTSGAHDFENVENFGYRYLHRTTAKTTPLKIQRANIAARLVKPAPLERGDKWNDGVATEIKASGFAYANSRYRLSLPCPSRPTACPEKAQYMNMYSTGTTL